MLQQGHWHWGLRMSHGEAPANFRHSVLYPAVLRTANSDHSKRTVIILGVFSFANLGTPHVRRGMVSVALELAKHFALA